MRISLMSTRLHVDTFDQAVQSRRVVDIEHLAHEIQEAVEERRPLQVRLEIQFSYGATLSCIRVPYHEYPLIVPDKVAVQMFRDDEPGLAAYAQPDREYIAVWDLRAGHYKQLGPSWIAYVSLRDAVTHAWHCVRAPMPDDILIVGHVPQWAVAGIERAVALSEVENRLVAGL